MSKTAEVAFLSDRNVRFNSGQELSGVHLPSGCAGRHCPIHNPSDHPLRGEALSFNGHNMIRTVDGVPQIDPDDYEFNRTGYAILRNSAKCTKCGDEVESTYRHDFQSCSCGEIFVDGGLSYIRRGAKDLDCLIDTSIVVGDSGE